MTQTDLVTRHVKESNMVNIFTDIYDEDVNMVVWNRELSELVKNDVDNLTKLKPDFQQTFQIELKDGQSNITKLLSQYAELPHLGEDIVELLEMFCCIFGLERAGLRMAVLHHAMCPKFHVDHVLCRLVTTYQGIATEWIPHNAVDRTKNTFQHDKNDICNLKSGDVALLKGENWPKNKNSGLVHRSPELVSGDSRLIFTLDIVA